MGEGEVINGDGIVPAWPYNGHWAAWFHEYPDVEVPYHPWAGHGWAPDGFMGHVRLAHFFPQIGQNEPYWWYEENDWGFGQALGLPENNDHEWAWYPPEWDEEMGAEFAWLFELLGEYGMSRNPGDPDEE